MAIEHVTLGNALIAIHHPTFFEGYTSGYLRYARADYQRPLTDGAIKQLLEEQFTTHTPTCGEQAFSQAGSPLFTVFHASNTSVKLHAIVSNNNRRRGEDKHDGN